jgi:hypothetical protein
MVDQLMFGLKNRANRARVIVLLLMFLLSLPANAFKAGTSTSAGKQRWAEKGLNDNRYFMYYINSTVTNFGTLEDKKTYKYIIQLDLVSQFYYMRFFFGNAWQLIYKSQGEMVKLYRRQLELEIKKSTELLNGHAAVIIQSKDALAKRYLSLGYRKARLAKIFMVMSDNYRPTLFSLRLHKYVHAMKKVKESKRYALLAAIQINLTPKEKLEKLKKRKSWKFEVINKQIEKITDSTAKIAEYRLHHLDSYYNYKEEKSFYDIIWEEPELEKLNEYQIYLKADN